MYKWITPLNGDLLTRWDRDDPSKVRTCHLSPGRARGDHRCSPRGRGGVARRDAKLAGGTTPHNDLSWLAWWGYVCSFANLRLKWARPKSIQNPELVFVVFGALFTGKQLCLMARNYGILHFLPLKPIQ